MDDCSPTGISDPSKSISDDSNNRIKLLEDKYAALLEKKIADLECTPIRTKENQADVQPNEERKESQTHAEQPGKTEPPKRIRFRVRRPDKQGIHVDSDDTKITTPVAKEEEQPNVGLIWLRVFSGADKYQWSKVDIKGEELRCLLQIKLAHYPDLHFPDPSNGIVETISMVSLFGELLHNWQRLDSVARWDDESEAVKSLMRDIGNADPADLAHPYGLLANNDKLRTAREDLQLLMDQVRESSDMKDYFAEQAARAKTSLVSFEWLWTIFRPGELVYSTVFMGRPQVFIVSRSVCLDDLDDDDFNFSRPPELLTLVCWTYDWVGDVFRRTPVVFHFRRFQGTKPIKALEVHPLEFHEYDQTQGAGSKEAFEDLLIKRGRKFQDLCTRELHESQVEFNRNAYVRCHGFHEPSEPEDSNDGMAMFERRYGAFREPRKAKVPRIVKTSGRVVLDTVSFMKYVSKDSPYPSMGSATPELEIQECRCAPCVSNNSLKDNQKTGFDGVQKLEDDLQFMLCPPRVLGYVLNKRIWAELDICEGSLVLDIEVGKGAKNFEALQLEKSVKSLVAGLVRGHTKSTGESTVQDFVKEKGQGLVVLLHGPSGTGKTSTAECVAELIGNPLLAVTIADLGKEAKTVEKDFQDIFDLAARWKAVLLFDEADVFFESRSSTNTDLKRSSFVSVLLRVLEYYKGILILTTNRITKLDTAVQSRVHLGIQYRELNESQLENIFNNFIDEINDDKVEDKAILKKWFREDDNNYMKSLDGRQIRNVLISAASLANDSGKRLGVTHVIDVARSMSRFQSSIRSIVETAALYHEAGKGH